jgi:hypothetical protein
LLRVLSLTLPACALFRQVKDLNEADHLCWASLSMQLGNRTMVAVKPMPEVANLPADEEHPDVEKWSLANSLADPRPIGSRTTLRLDA